MVPHVIEVHVRTRIQGPQGPVKAQGAGLKALLEPLANHHLHAITRSDVGLGAEHRLLELGWIALALHRLGRLRQHRRHTHPRLELLRQTLQALHGCWVGPGLGRISPNNQVQAPGEVVNDGHLLGQEQLDVWRAKPAAWAARGEARLDGAHGVVAKVARQATTKAGQTGGNRGLQALLKLRHEVQWIAFKPLRHHPVGHQFTSATRGAEQGAGRQANEGVAPKTLTTDH